MTDLRQLTIRSCGSLHSQNTTSPSSRRMAISAIARSCTATSRKWCGSALAIVRRATSRRSFRERRDQLEAFAGSDDAALLIIDRRALSWTTHHRRAGRVLNARSQPPARSRKLGARSWKLFDDRVVPRQCCHCDDFRRRRRQEQWCCTCLCRCRGTGTHHRGSDTRDRAPRVGSVIPTPKTDGAPTRRDRPFSEIERFDLPGITVALRAERPHLFVVTSDHAGTFEKESGRHKLISPLLDSTPIGVTEAPSSTLATVPMDSSRETPRRGEGSLACSPH